MQFVCEPVMHTNTHRPNSVSPSIPLTQKAV